MFTDIENYFCFGCNPAAENMVNTTNMTIRMCRSYLESVWGGPLNKPTYAYDGCGFYTYWRSSPKAVIPSQVRYMR